MFVCLFVCLFVCFHPRDFFMLKTCFEWVNFSLKKRFFLYWLIVCVCDFFHFFLSSKIFFQIFRTNLTTSSISCHASLTGTLVISVLQPNNRLAGLHGGIIKITFVLG